MAETRQKITYYQVVSKLCGKGCDRKKIAKACFGFQLTNHTQYLQFGNIAHARLIPYSSSVPLISDQEALSLTVSIHCTEKRALSL